MKKLKSTLPNMIMSLGVITIVAGAALGGMYVVTKAPIAEAQSRAQREAVARVTPPFNNDPEADAVALQADGREVTVYPAKMDGKIVGAAVKTSTMNGFSGEIVLMVGFTSDGTVKDYQVLSHAETPGLGAKMQEWFRDPTAARSIIAKNPAQTRFWVTKDTGEGGEVDGITAATITSRAFLDAVRAAHQGYMDYLKQNEK